MTKVTYKRKHLTDCLNENGYCKYIHPITQFPVRGTVWGGYGDIALL